MTSMLRGPALAALLALAASVLPMPARHAALAATGPMVPGTACPSFPADAVWNTDISALPVSSHSAAWLASSGAGSGRNLHPDLGAAPYGIPFNVVGSAHATVDPTFDYAGESDPGSYPWGSDLQVEAPTDSHLLSVNRDTCTLYETFATDIATDHAGSGAVWNLASDALRPDTWTSADAAGLPIFPLLLRPDEIDAGAVNHAIRFTVASTDTSYLWPARHQAGSASDPNLPPMGARFRLKASFDTSSFGREAQIVLAAFKHYGLLLADNGSNWFFQGSSDPEWDAPQYQAMVAQLKTVPASAFEAVDESALMVDPNSARAQAAPPPATSSYFTWYDRASPGMTGDNIHIVDPDASAPSVVTVRGPGPAQTVTVPAGAEQIVSWPQGTIGGPVSVTVVSGPAVLATQRVQFGQTFNEVAATPGPAAAMTAWFPWYDLLSPGMVGDNIHVLNPDPSAPAQVSVSGPGPTQVVTVPAFGERIVSWPGAIGGPVEVNVLSGPSVIASQRVEYRGSFNETPATPTAAAAPRSLFTWYDHASPGMEADDIHLTNPDPTADATVTVSGPGAAMTVTVPHAGQTFTSWPQGTIGGPVTVSVVSGPNVIASRRVRYGDTFNEVRAMPATSASSLLRFTWYDLLTGGMHGDDVHVLNPGAPASPAVHVVVSLAGEPAQAFDLAPGSDRWVSWPGGFGGPVTVASTGGPVLASQRVECYQSFNEVAALA